MAFVKEMAHINFGPFVSHNTIPNKQEFGTGVNIFPLKNSLSLSRIAKKLRNCHVKQ